HEHPPGPRASRAVRSLYPADLRRIGGRMARGAGRWKPWSWLTAVAVIASVGLIANAFIVNGKTRAALPRDGGAIIDTGIVAANVRSEGDGPAVVLIHGFSAAIDWWDDIAPRLAAAHRVIRVDLIGHGGTAAPDRGYSIERQAALVGAVLDKLGVD